MRLLLSSSSKISDQTLFFFFFFLLLQLSFSFASPGRRRSRPAPGLFLPTDAVVPCRAIGNTLLRGAFLRIASDLTGGTPLETIKTRVTLSTDGAVSATQRILADGGVAALWTGSSSRTVEGALIGAVFMLGRVGTQTQLKAWGASPTVAALAGGLVGGVAQSVVMTPAGMIFTALNNQKKKKGSQKETAVQVVRRVVAEKGLAGMFVGMQPMCIRQATNWASRSGFTELARAPLKAYGIWGELGAGAIGGVGSCWNTPIETIRVYMQRDVAQGKNPKPMAVYWQEIVQEHGVPGLFRGVTPRAIQAIWQTVFLVVVPNLMGL
jgi:Mitochondrial carrier protein